MFGLFSRSRKTDPVSELWAWVAGNRANIVEALKSGHSQRFGVLVEQLSERLHKVNPDLCPEMGMSSPDELEIVISANGIRDFFPDVLKLVQTAPAMPGVKLTPFRQRAPGFGLEMFERKIAPAHITFVSIDEGPRLGVDVYVDADLDEKQRGMVGFIMLDQTLGEYDVATALGSIVFHPGRHPDGRPLDELVAEVDARRPAKLH